VNTSDFINAAVKGNRELRKIGLSSISDDRMRFNAFAIIYTIVKYNLHTISEYLVVCKERESNETKKR